MSWLDMTLATKIDSGTLRKSLSGSANVFLESLWPILNALKLTIVVCKDSKRFEIMNKTELTSWAEKSFIFARLSMVKFANQMGITRMSLTSNMKGESKMRIDTFLKWCELTGYTVEII